MDDFDPTWREPTQAQLAALKVAEARPVSFGIGELRVAEMICTARHSLWYSQAKRWTGEAPKAVAEGPSREMFSLGAQMVCSIVERGYDAEKGWWPLSDVFPQKDELTGCLLVLMDFGDMLHRMTGGQMVISQGFFLFLDVVLGKGWEARQKRMAREMGAAAAKARAAAQKKERGEGGR